MCVFLPQGLRSCIPPNFPYFAVEMGLSSGHVHVIDDEASFDASFGRGVLIGLLQLPAEDMHRQAKQDSVAAQVGPPRDVHACRELLVPVHTVLVTCRCVCRSDGWFDICMANLQAQWAADFGKDWEPYDWTKQLG